MSSFFKNFISKILSWIWHDEKDDLKKQIEILKNTNEQLEIKLRSLQIHNKNPREISHNNVNNIVDKILENTEINIKYFPDWVEEKLYRNILTMSMSLVEEILNTSKICIMGHAITLDVQPEIPEINIDDLVTKKTVTFEILDSDNI